MTLAVILVCAVVEARAQTCVTPPDCGTLGYNKTTADCAGLDMLACPFDTSKVFCTAGGGGGTPSSEVMPGMIVYSDGTFSNSVISGKTPVGVVAYVEGFARFMVALEEQSSLNWGRGYDLSGITNYDSSDAAITDISGFGNTSCIMNESGDYQAAKYCNEYKPVSSGTGSFGWYLPAAGELYVMKNTFAVVSYALQKLGKTAISSGDVYWSSSEANGSNAWTVRPSDGNTLNYTKTSTHRVRCVLAF